MIAFLQEYCDPVRHEVRCGNRSAARLRSINSPINSYLYTT